MASGKTFLTVGCIALAGARAHAQMTDLTQAPNREGAGIHKSLAEQVGAGRGDAFTPDSSRFLIGRDPFRSIRRGRQLFQRKFTLAQGLGPRTLDGEGDLERDGSIGAGLTDSCASCHSRPFGSAGVGGNVFTRPDSRDAPHLFGLGLQEMLADEITRALRSLRADAIAQARSSNRSATVALTAKGIAYGSLTAFPDGSLDTTQVVGVDPDLRVRPFFAQGGTVSIREFVVGALNAEMGLECPDPDTWAASQGSDVVTPSGMLLSGSIDRIEAPPASLVTDDPDGDGVTNEIDVALVDHLEFYLLNYFKPGRGEITSAVKSGRKSFEAIGCASCHVRGLWIDEDRRVADVETAHDPQQGNGVFNSLYADAQLRHATVDDGSGYAPLQSAARQPFFVEGIFTDFKRHDLGPGFHERNFDGSITTHFMTEPLWGVADTAPYGHDGRSPQLHDVILRHGGEAQSARDAYAAASDTTRANIQAYLRSFVLFSPEDTASVLNPVNRAAPNYPMHGHGSISLTPLFNDPSDLE